MRDIVIVGAGGHGIEVAWLARRCNRNVRGFLDNTFEKQNTKIMGVGVLGTIDQATKHTDCEFIVAIGNPRNRKKIVDSFLSLPEFNFATLIDPTVVVGDNIKIGHGSMISAGSVLTVNVKIGEHCIVNINSTLSHGVEIGNFVTIAPNVSLSGDVKLESITEIGANAVLREKLIVKEGAMIGMGAVLTRNVEINQVMIGNPAKLFKVLDPL